METDLFFQILNSTVSIAVALMVISQLRQLKLSLNSSAQGGLYGQSAEVRKMISSDPKLYPYFFEQKGLDENASEDLKVKVKMTAMMYLSYFENLVTQEQNLHKKHRNTWANQFVKKSIQQSPIMKEIFENEPDIYVKEPKDCCIN